MNTVRKRLSAVKGGKFAITGPTGTNVNDVTVLLLRGQEEEESGMSDAR